MRTEKKYLEKIIKTEDDLKKMVINISSQLNSSFKNVDNVVLLVVMKGGLLFASDLSKQLNFDVKFDFINSKSYFLDKKVSKPSISYKPTISIKNQHVIVVDDYIDTGNTLKKILDLLKKYKPKSISVVGIYGNPKRVKIEFDEYYGWEEDPKGFLLGYGLDYDEKYRNLPYLGITKSKDLKKREEKANV